MGSRHRLRKYGKIALLCSITVVIFVVLFTRIDPKSVFRALVRSNKVFLVIALVVGGMIELLKAYRWQFTLSSSGYTLRFRRCLELELVAHPLNAVVPSKSGDAVKAYLIRDRVPLSVGLGTVVFVRVWDLAYLASFGVVGLVAIFPSSSYILFAVAGAGIIVVFGAILWFDIGDIRYRILSRVPTAVINYVDSVRMDSWHRLFIHTGLYSFLLFGLSIVQVLFFFYAVGISLPAVIGLSVIPIAILVGLVPITIGGMGTRDAAFVFLFSAYASPESLVAVGLLYSALRYWLLAVVGLPSMMRTGLSRESSG